MKPSCGSQATGMTEPNVIPIGGVRHERVHHHAEPVNQWLTVIISEHNRIESCAAQRFVTRKTSTVLVAIKGALEHPPRRYGLQAWRFRHSRSGPQLVGHAAISWGVVAA